MAFCSTVIAVGRHGVGKGLVDLAEMLSLIKLRAKRVAQEPEA